MKIRTIEMVRQIRDAHYEQLKDETRQEWLAFYQEKAQLMNIRVKAIRQARQTVEQVRILRYPDE